MAFDCKSIFEWTVIVDCVIIDAYYVLLPVMLSDVLRFFKLWNVRTDLFIALKTKVFIVF